jgi:hypothetical protein
MNSEVFLELFLSMMVFEIIGLLLFLFSRNLKRKENEKFINATKATVSSVRCEEERSNDDYFKKNTYILGLVYMYQSSYVMEDFYSDYEFDVDTIIDVEVVDGKVKSILTPPSKGIVDNFNSLMLKAHQIVFGISMFFCGFGVLAFTSNVIDLFGEKYKFLECAVLVGVLLSIYVLLNNRKEKQISKVNLIKSGGYTAIVGKIVDIKKKVTVSDGDVREYYYPIVEYQEGYDVKRKVIYNNIGKENKIDESMLIYKDRSTGEVLSELDVKFLEWRVKILKFFCNFVLVIIGLCVFSYL